MRFHQIVVQIVVFGGVKMLRKLYCVGGDVKPCSVLSQSINQSISFNPIALICFHLIFIVSVCLFVCLSLYVVFYLCGG